MPLFEYIFYLGVIIIVFTTIWKLLASIITSFLKDLGVSKDYSFLFFKAVSYYLLVSITALKTSQQMELTHPVIAVIYAISGTFIIYTTIAANLEKNRWRAVMNFERKRIRVMRYDGYLLMACIVLFILTLFKPQIADTPLHNWILQTIRNIYTTPVLQFFIAIFAFFYMINMIVRGVRATEEVLQTLFIRRQPTAGDQSRTDADGYTDYEEIVDDDQ
ncbi:MAG: hypothetical protein H6548_12030 [Chitinophagales bacterium]|nr:hypothetical protein [Chitinophagales bacterium]HAE13412.1 hypothetical protein [Bacteroidota bacterium]MCB9018936.1 hypothetical protein [Chitinophagales bacterium]MCB9022839.1 hypothetical protein [Chitinophagales bacterium]HAE34317.1 hypothetical protein [Bacteroidota bacterium]